MVLGEIINQVNDATGKITVSVWKVTDPPLGTPQGHHNFEVEVGSVGLTESIHSSPHVIKRIIVLGNLIFQDFCF